MEGGIVVVLTGVVGANAASLSPREALTEELSLPGET